MTKYTFQNQKKFKSYQPTKWVTNPLRNQYDTDYIKEKNLYFRLKEYAEKQNKINYQMNKNYSNVIVKKVSKNKEKSSINFKKYKNTNVLVVKKAGV